MRGRLFFDLTGLLHWYAYFRRPAGVQRVIEQVGGCSFVQRAARQADAVGAAVGGTGAADGLEHEIVFVVRLLGSDRFRRLDPGLMAALRGGRRPATVRRLRALFARSLRLASPGGLLREGRYYHVPYLAAGVTRTEGILWGEPSRSRGGDALDPVEPLEPVEPPTIRDAYFSPGDLWWQPRYAESIAGLKAGTGVRIVQMVHDLYVLDRPGWSPRGFSNVFGRQLRGVAPVADHWLASSVQVGRQIAERLEAWSLPPRPVTVLPMGWDSLRPAEALAEGGRHGDVDGAILRRLGLAERPFILFVGTIEPRKNLPALLDAMDDLRPSLGDRAPALVVAGSYGWRASATRARLREGVREGHTVWLQNLEDVELAAVYRAARFTVMPSHGEGWGLAVQESLAQGVPCIASSGGATREAGLDLATYVDPGQPDELRRAIADWILDEGALAGARSRVREAIDRGSLGTWDDAGRVLLGCAFPDAGDPGGRGSVST